MAATAHSNMQSRRSHTNLSNLTLAPLTTRSILDDDDELQLDKPTSSRLPQSSSYLAGKSAPTTPRILSRSPSRTRLGHSSTTKLATSRSYTNLPLDRLPGDLTKSRSTAVLVHGPHPLRKKGKIKSSTRLHHSTDHGEWLFRAGTAIASEAREYKGQSWLVSRESSTSLVAQNLDQDPLQAYSLETPVFDTSLSRSLRTSRMHSRSASGIRTPKTGSRTDLSFVATPLVSRPRSSDEDYFGQVQLHMEPLEPDFVDLEEEADDEDDDSLDIEAEEKMEEAEVARLTHDRGSGLGGLVDRFLGWTLFEVREDGQEESDNEEDASSEPHARERQTLSVHQPPATTEAAVRAARKRDAENSEAQSGWSDAAWLLSVASKVIL